MKTLFRLFICLAVVVFASCTGNPEPKDIAEDVAECIQQKNYKGLTDIIYASEENPSEKDKAQMTALFESKIDKKYEKKGGIKSFEVGEQMIDEEAGTAVVPVVFTFGNGKGRTENYKFSKKEGKWYFVMR